MVGKKQEYGRSKQGDAEGREEAYNIIRRDKQDRCMNAQCDHGCF